MIAHDDAARVAIMILAFRRLRSAEFAAGLFGEPAWECLLELFVADAKGVRMTGRDVCERAHLSPALMSRWLKYLTAENLIVGDGDGDIDDELTLSGVAFAKLEHLLHHAQNSIRNAIGAAQTE